MNAALIRRLLSHVEYDTNGGCWLWSAYCEPTGGYGRVNIEGRSQLAHRASWVAHFESIPADADALHRCDVPSCINPMHLFLGDDFVNQQDRRAKGRHNNPDQRGMANPITRLSDADVIAIRALADGGAIPQTKIAKMFGVSQPAVSLIKQRKTWAHLR